MNVTEEQQCAMMLKMGNYGFWDGGWVVLLILLKRNYVPCQDIFLASL